MTILTPRSPARSTSGRNTCSASRRLSATLLVGVAADEGADRGHPQQRGGVDERQDMGVDGFALGRVGVQVVVVEGQRRQREAVPVEQRGHLVGLPLAEAVDVEVGGGERPVAQRRPRGDLQRLEAVLGGPGGDVGQAALAAGRRSGIRASCGHLHPVAGRGGRHDRVGDQGGPQAVGEGGQAVRAGRRRPRRRRRRRRR